MARNPPIVVTESDFELLRRLAGRCRSGTAFFGFEHKASPTRPAIVLHPHGQRMSGRWVGMSYDGKVVTGWGSRGRDEQAARDTFTELITEGGSTP